MDMDSLASIIYDLVISRYNYCNALYMELPLKMVQKQQLVQNVAAKLITGTQRSKQIRPILGCLD